MLNLAFLSLESFSRISGGKGRGVKKAADYMYMYIKSNKLLITEICFKHH